MEEPEKLCETDENSGVMEPKETESKTEAQKSDVQSEVREPKPKQIETETGSNESENESIGSKRVMYVKEMVFIQQMSLKNTKTMIQTKLKGVMYGLRTVRETAIHHMNHTN